ncbi:MAG: type II secretion system protein [Patescibacteria group bacterium]
MRRTSGFTVIELISAVVLILIVGTLVVLQKNNLDAASRDQQRKTSINAIYYGLKRGYFVKNGNYPSVLNKNSMPYVDPKAFQQVGSDKQYTIKYRGLDCENTQCKGFELKTSLEKEAIYKRTND